jgi:aminopeptidase YwaD
MPGTIRDLLVLISGTIGERPTGSENNRIVQDRIRGILERKGCQVRLQEFDCREWTVQNVACFCEGGSVPVVPSPFSPSCRITAPVVVVSSLAELRDAEITNRIALLSGDLTSSPLTPKNFPFYQPEEHREIIRILEEKTPLAVITEANRTDYAVPVIIDGDLLIPSCTITRLTGDTLRSRPGDPLSLTLATTTRPARAANVIARIERGSDEKIVVCAHMDTKFGTPGALDNAAGVVALLSLISRLQEVPPDITVECVFFNGEECYSVPGEMTWLREEAGNPEKISLAINIDGIGLAGKGISIAYFTCPDPVIDAAELIRSRFDTLSRVDPWPQGDHSLFSMQGIPGIALTTDAGWDEIDRIIHTPADTPDIVDEKMVEETVLAVEAIIRAFPTGK